MAIQNVGGHAVTSVLAGTDHVVAKAAPAQFQNNTGAAGYNGIPGGVSVSKKKSGFPPAK